MESSNDFNLNHAINEWAMKNLSKEDLTAADESEFRSHFHDCIDELMDLGLSEEEAFIIAQKRFGTRLDWGTEMEALNEDNFQLKKVILLLGGIVLYVFLYNLILVISRSVLIITMNIIGDPISSLNIIKTFFNFVYFFSFSGIVALYFLHQPIKWLISKITIRLLWVVISIIIVGIIVVIENYLVPQVAKSLNDSTFKTLYYNQEFLFKYIYTLFVSAGFLLIFIRYVKRCYM